MEPLQSLPSFTWFNPTRVMFSVGELQKLASVVDETAGTSARVFLVTGSKNLRARGILKPVVDSLGPTRVNLFDKVTPFPSPDMVDAALVACRAASADVVVAIGGGSAIDVGKAVAILMAHDGTSREYALGQKELQRQGLPFIAVPTTSGSSSEVTSSAALWDMEAQRSMALSHPLMFPTVSVVDPELAMSMPKTLAAVTGMDAFTSAIEGYWSLESEPATDALDLEVVRLYAANLERSCIQGDLESRTACALAATVSGIACSNSHVNVCHAIGGPLTLFWGVDHGHSVAITLPAFLRWNAPAISHKLPALWDALGVGDLEEAVTRITQMLERCGLETRLHGLGLGDGDLETVVTNMSRDRLGLVPQPLEMEDIRALLRELI